MKNEKMLNKMNRIANKENGKMEWDIPEITTIMENISNSFKTLFEISKSKEVTDDMLLKVKAAKETLDKNVSEILSRKEYKKYHALIEKKVLPEANQMYDEIENREIAKSSTKLQEAQKIIDQMKEIARISENDYYYLKNIIESSNSNAAQIARIEGDQYSLIESLDRLSELRDKLVSLTTISQFEFDLLQTKQEGVEYCLNLMNKIIDNQEKLETLDKQHNPNECLFYSESLINNYKIDEKENQ